MTFSFHPAARDELNQAVDFYAQNHLNPVDPV